MRYFGIVLVMLGLSSPVWAGKFPLGVWGIWMSGEQYKGDIENKADGDFDNVKGLGVNIIGGGIPKYDAEAKHFRDGNASYLGISS